jgi:hypothetical protein
MRSPDVPRGDAADSENAVEGVRPPPLAEAEIDDATPAPAAAASTSSPSDASFRTTTDDLRSIALSITTEKLRIRSCESPAADGPNPSRPRPPRTGSSNPDFEGTDLVDRAVESATHAVVTDAIETLLVDEDHTKQTYLKHEQALSVSTLRGVVPISKQLFSPEAAPLAPLVLSSASPPPPSSACSGRQSQPPPPVPFSSPDNPAEITPPLEPQEAVSGAVVPDQALETLSAAAVATEEASGFKEDGMDALESSA